MCGSYNGRVECLKLLLAKNNVNALSTDKRSPLFLARGWPFGLCQGHFENEATKFHEF